MPEPLPCPLVPSPGQVIVERDTPETQTKGGIIIPTTAQGKPNTGVILKVPPTCSDFPVGLRILFPEYEGIDVNVNERALTILRTDAILASFEK